MTNLVSRPHTCQNARTIIIVSKKRGCMESKSQTLYSQTNTLTTTPHWGTLKRKCVKSLITFDTNTLTNFPWQVICLYMYIYIHITICNYINWKAWEMTQTHWKEKYRRFNILNHGFMVNCLGPASNFRSFLLFIFFRWRTENNLSSFALPVHDCGDMVPPAAGLHACVSHCMWCCDDNYVPPAAGLHVWGIARGVVTIIMSHLLQTFMCEALQVVLWR